MILLLYLSYAAQMIMIMLLYTQIMIRMMLAVLHGLLQHQEISKVCAVLCKVAVVQGLWEDASIEQLEQVPLACTALGLEVPKDPALGAHLESVELDLDVPADSVLPVLRPRVDSSRLAVAGVNVRRTGETTVHARAGCKAIQVLCAVGESTRPLADNSPLIRSGIGVDLAC